MTQVKDKYLSVCKTKLKDRYGKEQYRYEIINYPGYIDKSLSETKQLLKHGKISFGELKGLSINELTKEQALYYTTSRTFALDKDIRDAFLQSKFKDLVQKDTYYASLKKKTQTKRNRKKKKQTKRNRNTQKILYCFTMEGCSWCQEFQKDLWPQLKQLKLCRFKIIDGPTHKKLVKKYNIKTYPSLVVVHRGNFKLFKSKRTIKNIIQFCK